MTSAPTADLDSRFSDPQAGPTPWSDAAQLLESAELYWLTTVRADGRPHVTPLIGVADDGVVHFCTGLREQKARNLEHGAHVALTTGNNTWARGLDVVVEGSAVRVTDQHTLERLADAYEAKYGSAWHGNVDDGERMDVPSTGGRGPRALQRIKLVKDVIEPRVTEIFEFIKEDLLRSGYFDSLAAGIVLTGGATAMDGVTEIAEQVLELQTRRGSPIRIGGLVDVVRSPAYATGVGLVMFGAEQGKSMPLPARDERPGMFKRAWSRIAEIF